MALPEYKSKRNYTWQNIGMSLPEFAQKLSPYLSGGAGGTYQNTGNSSTNSNIDWSAATVQELNLDNNPTLTFSNGVEGASLSLLLKSGTTQRDITWPSNVTWSRGIEPTIAKATSNGSIDPAFLSGTGFTQYGSASSFIGGCFTLSTGKILVYNDSSSPTSYNGVLLPGNTSMSGKKDLIRLNEDGTIDTTWTQNNWQMGSTGGVKCIFELPDGRILVGGDFTDGGSTSFNGNSYLQLLSADGVRDNTFLPQFQGGFAGAGITSIVKQSTGKIIVGGDFTFFNSSPKGGTARFNADLTVDNSFTGNIGSGNSPRVNSIAVDSSDSVFVGGNFNGYSVNGSGSYSYLVKLDANGNIAPFNYGLGGFSGGSVTQVAVNSLGKVVVAGSFFSYNGTTANGLTTLLPDGTIDPLFVAGNGTNGYPVPYMKLLSDDRIVALGNQLVIWNGTSVSKIFIVDPNGSLDTDTPIPASGLNSGMSQYYGLAIQTNGNILVTGSFSTYGGATANAIVSIKNSSVIEDVYSTVDFKYNGVKYIGSF